MEITKRTYQKHKTEKKITVKHYLIPKRTTSLHDGFEISNDTTDKFEIHHVISPIYVQVTYNRKSTKFRSELKECYISSIPEIPIFEVFDDYKKFYLSEKSDLICGLTRDANYIKWIVEQEIRINPNFDISGLPEIYHSLKYGLVTFVEYCLNGYIQVELMNRIEYTKNDKQKKLSDYPNTYVDVDVSALQNLEYFTIKYPELELFTLKDNFSPQIWLLSIYLTESKTIRDFDLEIQDNTEFVYLLKLPTKITIFDYLTNIIEENFLSENPFTTIEIKERIYGDIKRLFAEHYEYYDFGSFLNKHMYPKIPLRIENYKNYADKFGNS